MSIRNLSYLLLAALICAAAASAQRGALTRTRNLAQLTDQAASIIDGHVVSARVERHPTLHNLDTIVVSVRVSETLKGPRQSTLEFRQFVWDIRDRQDAAGYRKGERLLLLLNPPTEYGLTSPAGLEQGRFRILRDRSGADVAVNGHGNYGLFRGLRAELTARRVQPPTRIARLVDSESPQPVPASELRTLIRSLVEAQR